MVAACQNLWFPHQAASTLLSGCMRRASRSGAICSSYLSDCASRPIETLRRRTEGRGSELFSAPVSAFPGAEKSSEPRPRLRAPNAPGRAKTRSATRTNEVKGAQPRRTGTQPDQAESAALMRALTAPMSARPAAFAFTIAHHLAHVLHGRGAGGRDGVLDQGVDFGVGELRGQVGLQQLDLGLFLGGEVGASALFELDDRFLALLEHLLDDRRAPARRRA